MYFDISLTRPLRTQSSAGTRATSAETTPSQPRPVTAAALPSQPTGGDAAASSASGAGASARVQLSDLQNILSTMNGQSFICIKRVWKVASAPSFFIEAQGKLLKN